ncbi:hypothetical protein CVV68_03440 [Arthrobacter livingstonensis]|uniref:Uncharacterized protein n=2 Tax=Arthrobacter livingstonensis TaxID=670078 RepID=A0A2V5LFD6_9MICC|nr:hypothetical protein CVV68_03440 [Arthrobacter livingstonensis]
MIDKIAFHNNFCSRGDIRMPLWQIIAIIVVAWLAAAAGIVVFMMGASRGRRSEKQAQQQLDRQRLQPAHREEREDTP